MKELNTLLEGIQISHVEKTMLLERSLATTTFQVNYRNIGSKTHSNVYFVLNNSDYEHLAVFTYKEDNSPIVAVKKSKFNQLIREDPNTLIKSIYYVYEVSVTTALKIEDTLTITYTMIATNKLSAYPKELELNVPPMYVFEDSINMISLYPVKTQTSSYNFKQSQVISYTPEKGANVIGKKDLSYTMNNEVEPFHSSPFQMHISTTVPYTSTTTLHRKVYVSEYADVEFVESHTIYNRANKLIGEFSRDRVGKSQVKTSHIIGNIMFVLPKDSYNYYYRDMVGNISTSKLTDTRNARIMDVSPRFPLMGGWNTEFTIKYKRPSEKIIKKQFDQIDAPREFSINLLGVCSELISVEHFILEIILPEHAEMMEFDIPTTIDFNLTKYNTYYYMDMAGRVTLRIEAHNLISTQDTQIRFTYSYNSIYLLRKPYYATFVFFIVFFTVAILSRTRIYSSHDNSDKGKLDDLLDSLQQFDDLALAQLESIKKLLSIVDSYKNKEIQHKTFESKFSTLLNTLNADMIVLTNDCNRLCAVFHDCEVELNKKLAFFKQYLELIHKYHDLVVKFKEGGMVESAFSKSYKDIDNQIKCNMEVVAQLFD